MKEETHKEIKEAAATVFLHEVLIAIDTAPAHISKDKQFVEIDYLIEHITAEHELFLLAYDETKKKFFNSTDKEREKIIMNYVKHLLHNKGR